MQKTSRPKVSVPSQVKIMAMLNPRRTGKIDRQYIRSMCSAIANHDKHKNDNIRKILKESSSDE